MIDPDDLAGVVSEVRSAGKRIAFTNGCFDLLHVGHLRILEAAARQAEFLIVGLNGDASVRRLKGDSRPIVPFAERAELLAGLAAVDLVVGFDEDTPLALIETIAPDVLVKGADWAYRDVVGREVVEHAGGRVFLAPLVPQRSTRRLVDRLRRPPDATA
ncbi:MAG: adenylyltransferase/cytidyltransferase family protein [bacterium]|nr:adenylyltransferase/cytidyltransferase family protein [bacterium]